MIRITYLHPDGQSQTVETAPGPSLMAIAVAHGVRGIDGDCGGECICATCHVHVESPWRERLSPVEEAEQWTLEMAIDPDPTTSRLACQIRPDETMDGLVVRLPSRQR